MKVKILSTEFTVKVISIDKNSLSKFTIDMLEGFETYQDNQIHEHLYGCEVKDDINENLPLTIGVEKQLEEIRDLCNKNNASYFRIVNQ